MPIFLIGPLLAGFFYTLAVLFSKKAMQGGASVRQTLFVNNWTMFMFFLPLFFMSDGSIDWEHWYYPAFAGLCFFLGQVTTFLAIQWGDVSVQAPLMGTKVVFVALLTMLFSSSVIPASWWIGAALTMVAVFLLNSRSLTMKRSILPAVLSALLSAICFAGTDFTIQETAMDFGYGQYGMIMFLVTGLLSMLVLPSVKGGLFALPRSVLASFLAGNFLLAFQAMILFMTISHYGKATAVNILYSSRGIWSIILVWFVGHWFANNERSDAGGAVMVKRFIGSVLMLAAIAIVLGAEA